MLLSVRFIYTVDVYILIVFTLFESCTYLYTIIFHIVYYLCFLLYILTFAIFTLLSLYLLNRLMPKHTEIQNSFPIWDQ